MEQALVKCFEGKLVTLSVLVRVDHNVSFILPDTTKGSTATHRLLITLMSLSKRHLVGSAFEFAGETIHVGA